MQEERRRFRHARTARAATGLSTVILAGFAIAGTAATTAAAGSSGSTASCMAKARAIVAQKSAPIKFEAQKQPIKMAKLRGKTIYVVNIGSGYSLRVANAVAAAARVAGIKTVIASGVTPQDWNTSIQQAVQRHAGGIMFIAAIVPQLVQQSTAQAKAAGIPIVASDSIPPAPVNITKNVLIGTNSAGVAAQAAIDHHCHVDAIIALDPAYIGLVSYGQTFASTLQQLCPSTCKSQTLDLSLATLATQTGPALQSALARDPSINAAYGTFDSLALLMKPALQSSGSKATLYGADGDPGNMALVKAGQQGADYSFAPGGYEGYEMMDTLARAMLKVKNSPAPMQFQLFTPASYPKNDSFGHLWPNLVGYQNKFKKLWGLS